MAISKSINLTAFALNISDPKYFQHWELHVTFHVILTRHVYSLSREKLLHRKFPVLEVLGAITLKTGCIKAAVCLFGNLLLDFAHGHDGLWKSNIK